MHAAAVLLIPLQAYLVSSIAVQKKSVTREAEVVSPPTNVLLSFNNLAIDTFGVGSEQKIDDVVNDMVVQADDRPLTNAQIDDLQRFDGMWTAGVQDWVEDVSTGVKQQMDDDTEGGRGIMWLAFTAVICVGMFVDLYVLQSHRNVLTMKKAAWILAGWGVVTMLFITWILLSFGRDGVVIWLDGYLLETMLSVDNLFVFVVVMKAFRVPNACRGKVLMIGVVAALVLRVVMFGTIALLIHWAHAIAKVLGGFIIYCAYKMVMMDDDDEDEVTDNACVNWMRAVLPLTEERDAEGSLFIGGKATPIFLAAGALIFLDVVFAVDSVSAKSALISDLYLNYTSTGFAMFALRAKYALLESAADMFEYLKYGIAAILGLIGLKTIFPEFLFVTDLQYLFLLGSILAVCIVLSVVMKTRKDWASPKTASSKAEW